MAELLLVANPHRRKRRHRKGRMPPALARYWATHRRGHKKHSRRHHAAHATHRRRHHHRQESMSVRVTNPRRRRRNPAYVMHRRHHRHHRYRNPSYRFGDLTRQVFPTLKAGAWGATGALGLDALWGLVSPRLGGFSAYLANPYVGFAAKAFGAVTVGALGGRIARGKGRELAVGAMTVVTHDFLKSLLQGLAPKIVGAYLSGSAPIVGTATIPQSYLPFSGERTGSGYGAYLSGADGQYSVPYKDDSMGEDLIWLRP